MVQTVLPCTLEKHVAHQTEISGIARQNNDLTSGTGGACHQDVSTLQKSGKRIFCRLWNDVLRRMAERIRWSHSVD
jgi:hypothetical protein